MASRRMKIKVSVNVGRPGRVGEGSSGIPAPDSYHSLTSPGSPTKSKSIHTSFNQAPGSPTKYSQYSVAQGHASKDTDFAQLTYPAEISPAAGAVEVHGEYPDIKETSNRSFSPRRSPSPRPPPMSPDYKSNTAKPQTLSIHAPKSPVSVKARSCSPTKSPGPISYEFQPKSPTKFHASSEVRGPGRGPAGNSSSSSTVLSNLQKEIGAANVGNMNSNETLRQRLQKGTGFSTTKYATIRKEFLSKYPQCGTNIPDKSELTILHFTFWNPPSSVPEDGIDDGKLTKEESMIRALEENMNSGVHAEDSAGGMEDEPEKKPSTGPRVKIGPDGELILDEQSLVIETSESQRAQKKLNEMETVSGAGFTIGSSGFYRHKRAPKRSYDWSMKETVRFYRALTSCGTDFSMMQQIFSRRTRAELKAKFKREDRRNPTQISRALSCQTFDPMEEFSSEEEEPEEELSLPVSKKARRNSTKEAVSVLEEISKVVGSKIVGDSPALEAYIKRPQKSEPEPEPKFSPAKKGRPGKFMKTQKLSFVPETNAEYPEESGEEKSLFPQSVLSPAEPEVPKITKAKAKVPKEKRPKLRPETKEADTVRKEISLSVISKEKAGDVEIPIKNTIKIKNKKKKITPELHSEIETKRKKSKRTPKLKPSKSGRKKPRDVPSEGAESNPCPEILRFDPSDPLGLKVLMSPPGVTDAESHVATSDPMMPRLVLVTTPEPQRDLGPEPEGEPSSVPASRISLPNDDATGTISAKEQILPVPVPQNTRRSKIKPKLRVPTGGDMDKNRKRDRSSMADEIEIEISCE